MGTFFNYRYKTKDLKKDLLAEPPSPSPSPSPELLSPSPSSYSPSPSPSPSPAKMDLSPDSSPSPDSSTTSLVITLLFHVYLDLSTRQLSEKNICDKIIRYVLCLLLF